MRLIKTTLLIMFISFSLFSANAQTTEKQSGENLQVYYFHNTKRCITCNAVESETRTALEMFYADKMKDGTIEFTSLNLEKENGKEMAKSLKISGQTLLVVKGDKKVNLTNAGFMNARTNPVKFHDILKKEIDGLF